MYFILFNNYKMLIKTSNSLFLSNNYTLYFKYNMCTKNSNIVLNKSKSLFLSNNSLELIFVLVNPLTAWVD